MQTIGDASGKEGAALSFPPGINFLNSVSATAEAIGSSRSRIYEMIGAGELEAVKDGARTLIYGESILKRTASLPRARIGKSKEAA